MAKAMDVSTQALTSAGVGFASKYSSQVIRGDFTEFIVAGGLGLIGVFGATSGKGMYEKMGVGAVDGAASFFGVKMADWFVSQATTITPPTQSYQPYGYNGHNVVTPKLIGYKPPTEKPLENKEVTSVQKTSSKSSFLEI